ncbi:unnamed protein product [Oreochromis niloticus]|nr:unnamed protein product [Mustela putorius furo]
MGKTADLTAVQKAIIDTLKQEGKTQKEISERIGCSQSAVSRHLSGKSVGRKMCGRKRCTTRRGDRTLRKTVEKDRFQTLGDLRKQWTESGVETSRATVYRRVQEMGYRCRIPQVKPLLNQKQRQKRLTWATEKQHWTVAQWSKVLFSDESNFCMSFGNQGARVWRKTGEREMPKCLKSSVKYPQSVMVWGAMSAAGVGPLCFIKGRVNAASYQEILEHFMLPSAEKLYGDEDFIFQHDLAPAHSAKATVLWYLLCCCFTLSLHRKLSKFSDVSLLDVRMGATLLCELGLFLLCTLLCTGHAQDAVLTIEPKWSSYFIGEFVTFKCKMNEGKDTDWEYTINKDGRQYVPYSAHKVYTLQIGSTGDSGTYQCSGTWKGAYYTKISNAVFISVLADKPRATLRSGITIIPVGGSVTLTCSVQSSDGWKYEWFRRPQRTYEVLIRDQPNRDIRVSQGGIYRCRGTRGNPVYYTDISDEVTIEITTYRPRATLTAGTTIIPVGGSVTLTCSVQSSDGWKYEWFRRTQRTSEVQIRDQQNRDIRVSQGGIYSCRGTRGNPVYYTDKSVEVTVEITFSNKVVVKQQPNWPQIFRGETITLTCEVQEGGETTEWEYEWRGPSTPTQWTHNNDVTFRVSESSSGDYMCKSRRRDDSYSSTEWSEAFTLSASTAPESESSSFVTPLIVGLVCGVLLILLLLLLLCRFKQSKDSFFVRTRSTNQSAAMNHIIKDEAQHSQHASTLQGDACVYESIKDHDDTQNDDSVLYAEVSHDRAKTKKDNDDSLLYAQVYYTKAKPKRHKGKPAPAAADDTVYSEVKSQTALGNCAEIK